MQSSCYKKIQIRPLQGVLDTRSLAEHVPFGGYRWLENVSAVSKGRICRATGFEKLFGEQARYNNFDLHDQLGFNSEGYYDSSLPLTRQPINSIFQAVSTRGISQLLVGTQNRIYANNATTGNWRVISDQYGGTPTQNCVQPWRFAQQRNIVVMTNGMDEPIYHILGQPLIDGDNQGVDTIDSLRLIGLSKAQTVVSWRGFILWGNVVMDGVRADDRIVWSDYDKPLSYKPAKSKSLAGFHDLGKGESILAMVPLGNLLMIYTTTGIWGAQVVGGDEVIGFQQRYTEPEGGNSCLAYPETIVSLGDEHLYFGRDGIYLNSPYLPKPDRVPWMHLASATIFEDIDPDLCSVHCGGYETLTKTAWWSWAKKGDGCNRQTMRFNTEYPFADYLPIGFSAFAQYQPDQPTLIRQFLVDRCICENAEIGTALKSGGFCPGTELVFNPDCDPAPASIYTVQSLDLGDGKTTENYMLSDPDTNSLTALLDMTPEELCASELAADECNAELRFVMASTVDNSLKQTGKGLFHEFATRFTQCGLYRKDGYDTIIRSGPNDFRSPGDLKSLRRFIVDFIADLQSTPNDLQLRIGAAYQPADPNTDECGMVWHVQKNKPLSCNTKTSAQHLAANTRPNLGTEWPLFLEGHYLYWELKISGTGGGACFGSVSMEVAIK